MICLYLIIPKNFLLLILWDRFWFVHIPFGSKVKLATLVEGNQKAPFSIATTLMCRGGCDSFPWIAPLYPWYVAYIAECYARRYQVPFLKSLVWRDLGLNPGHLDHWQTLYPLYQNFNFLHNPQWISFCTQSCLVLYSFGANLLHSLIIWFASFTY